MPMVAELRQISETLQTQSMQYRELLEEVENSNFVQQMQAFRASIKG